MSRRLWPLRLAHLTNPAAPAPGETSVYANSAGQVVIARSDGTQDTVESTAGAAAKVSAHEAAPDPHPQYVKVTGGNLATITDPAQPNGWTRVNLLYTATSTTRNALEFRYNGILSGYHNEYGELRARAATQSTTPFRAMAHENGSAGYLIEAANFTATNTYFGVKQTGVDINVDTVITGNLTVTGDATVRGVPMRPMLVLGPADPIPAGTPAGTVILRTS